jgi:hypothetical protein
MEVLVSEAARDLVREGGGKLYVWVRKSRCCSGGVRTLASDLVAPRGIEFRSVDDSRDFELFVPRHLGRLPDELHIEIRRFRRRVEAYWNGCAWVI